MLAFNRGRFNRPTNKSVLLSGDAALEVTAAGCINAAMSLKGTARITVLTYFGAAISVRAIGEVSRVRFLGEASDGTRVAKFNRMGFNRGKFNASAHKRSNANISMAAAGELTAARCFSGAAEIEIQADSGALNVSNAFSGDTEIILLTDGYMNAARSFEGAVEVILSALGYVNVIRGMEGAALTLLKATSREFNTFRLEYIELPNLTLAPGDELIIDTDTKTITLNGTNVMRYLSRASEFFQFNPRENEIEYISSNPDDHMEVRILWKDAWL